MSQRIVLRCKEGKTLTYDKWKEFIQTNLEHNNIRFVFPRTKNFVPVTKPVFKYKNKIYRCNSKKFVSIELLENYIEQNNLAIFYIYEVKSTKISYMLRAVNLDTEELKNSLSVNEFVDKFKLEHYNTEEQIDAIKDIGLIFFIKKRIIDIVTSNVQLVSYVYYEDKIYK